MALNVKKDILINQLISPLFCNASYDTTVMFATIIIFIGSQRVMWVGREQATIIKNQKNQNEYVTQLYNHDIYF